MSYYHYDVSNNYRQTPQPLNDSLLSSLQEGGFILYARHAEATIGADQPNLNYQDCYTQRNLSNNGRMQAVTYGNAIRSLNIPIMPPVITSPFCRNIETAYLAFGEANTLIDPLWVDTYNLSGALSQSEFNRILNNLTTIFETQPAPGSNNIIIAHSFPEGVGLGPLPNMGTVVIRPFGQGNGFEIVDQLTLSELLNLHR
ncbi:histidine phosphatase family protein [Bacillus sp. FJAT-45350]|uniref:histidine phosphatase family protein n=1 Tax=Bacillus sp. FJAT-45350 TaxID=2011014 RepID=UPI0015C8203C|nr:histidine phosphatase family protein [Bacillus sp. FJAT-45350]